MGILMVSISACYYDVEEELYPGVIPCDSSNVTYAAKVLPIITFNCFGCHSASVASGNVILEGHSNLKTYADNGRLIGSITHAPGFSPMPKGGNKLSECDINIIQAWITSGAANN